jgi:hypothetical protein
MKDAMVPNAMPAALQRNADDARILSGHLDGSRVLSPDAFEAEIHAAHRKPAFAWLGLLTLMAPWGMGAVLLAAMRFG